MTDPKELARMVRDFAYVRLDEPDDEGWRSALEDAATALEQQAARVAELEQAIDVALDIIGGNKLGDWRNAVAGLRTASARRVLDGK